MEIVQGVLGIASVVSVLVALFLPAALRRRMNPRVQATMFGMCLTFVGLHFLSLAPTFTWSAGRIIEAALAFAVAGICAYELRLSLDAAKRNMQEPCGICSDYGCPDCRADQQGS